MNRRAIRLVLLALSRRQWGVAAPGLRSPTRSATSRRKPHSSKLESTQRRRSSALNEQINSAERLAQATRHPTADALVTAAKNKPRAPRRGPVAPPSTRRAARTAVSRISAQSTGISSKQYSSLAAQRRARS